MVRGGFRADEVTYPTHDRLRWSSGGDCWLVEVRGKNTKGGAKQTRDAWLPEGVAENIQRFVSERNRDPTEYHPKRQLTSLQPPQQNRKAGGV